MTVACERVVARELLRSRAVSEYFQKEDVKGFADCLFIRGVKDDSNSFWFPK